MRLTGSFMESRRYPEVEVAVDLVADEISILNGPPSRPHIATVYIVESRT